MEKRQAGRCGGGLGLGKTIENNTTRGRVCHTGKSWSRARMGGGDQSDHAYLGAKTKIPAPVAVLT